MNCTSESLLDIIPETLDVNISDDIYTHYIADICKIDLLSKEDEAAHSHRAKAGCIKSRNTLIESNLRLVVKVARGLHIKNNRRTSLLDLIADGNIGLMKAVEKFDASMGYRFSTYAMWWIRDSIQTSIMNNSRTVRLPIHIQKEINRLSKKVKGVSLNELTVSKLVEKSAPDTDDRHMQQLLQSTDFITIKESATYGNPPVYLDEMPNPDENSPEEYCTDIQLSEHLEDIIVGLPDRQRELIVRRFGLFGGEVAPLADISEEWNLSKERVRQLQKEAVERVEIRVKDKGW
ncbi:sigma-70 family RNA polymerase sigma factor [Vibrio crassostreae]|uniref:sigma-70 family RNA polymerase sigma factor n=1 Tax=Vibrio crassostreae TaxID=246167 RepID=UPI001B30DCD1|nr:sigma-70 family RNA polymerase sigma factor [Vibrio crassostreae]